MARTQKHVNLRVERLDVGQLTHDGRPILNATGTTRGRPDLTVTNAPSEADARETMDRIVSGLAATVQGQQAQGAAGLRAQPAPYVEPLPAKPSTADTAAKLNELLDALQSAGIMADEPADEPTGDVRTPQHTDTPEEQPAPEDGAQQDTEA